MTRPRGTRAYAERGVEAAAIARADWLASFLYGPPPTAATGVCRRLPFTHAPRFTGYLPRCAGPPGAPCQRTDPRPRKQPRKRGPR